MTAILYIFSYFSPPHFCQGFFGLRFMPCMARRSPFTQSAGLGAQFVKTLKISNRNDFQAVLGEWLCREQNEWENRYDKALYLRRRFFPADMKA